MSRKFQPTAAALLFSLLAFVLMMGLGVWQMKRLEWKTALLAGITTQMQKPPVPLPEKMDNPAAWEYRRVTMAGRFFHDHAFLVKPRTLDGVSGYHMLVPFQRLSGGVVMVNRGWITDALMSEADRPPGVVQIEGIVQLPHPTSFTPTNNPEKNDWYWPDAEAMAAAAKLKLATPAIVTIASKTLGVYPVGGKVTVNIRNDHRQYAIFWFVMAFLSQGVFFLSHWKRTTA